MTEQEQIDWLKSCPKAIPPEWDVYADIDLIPVPMLVYPDHQVGMENAMQEIPTLPITPKQNRAGDITKGVGRERAIQRAFNRAVTPRQLYTVAKTMVEVAQDKEHPQCVAAGKEIMNRMLGKVPLKVQQQTTTVKTVEERKTFFLKMLGVDENAPMDLIDGEVISGSEEGNQEGRSERLVLDPPALPAEVSAGQEPVHSVGEVPPNRSDVDECAQERAQTDFQV